MTSVRRLTLAATALATATAILLTGCANQEAGAAATFTDGRIAESDLTSAVAAVLEAKGQATTTSDLNLVQQTLGRMITQRLVSELAEQEGVEITQGMLDEMRVNYEGQVGSPEALEQAFLQENVAPSQLEAVLRLQLQAQELGYVFNPRGSAEEQGLAVFEAVTALSEELETNVSPRFGTWDPTTLSLGAVPNDLAAPPTLD
jgi:PBP1b-binding outer membrane lipoprotein LpoB